MPLAGIAGGVQASAGLMGLLLGIFPPLLEEYQQFAFNAAPNKLPDLGTAVALKFREQITESDMSAIFKKSGINNQFAGQILRMSEQMLSIGEYLTLWRREVITEGTLDVFLRKLRLNDEDIYNAKQVTEFFPTPSDLVQFAVREVYTPDVVSKFGQMEDIPDKFLSEASKAGLPKEQAQNYWAAHWSLPSPGQGFAMFQRDIIDEATLKMLLKSLDIMPYWRDMLVQLSYTPLTRVDVRRMHDMGILDDEGVEDAYRARGYSPENAKNMLDFTKLYNSQETTGLTRASIIKGYKRKLVSRSELQEVLEQFGYAEEVINFWVAMADLELELEEIQAAEDDLLKQYRKGNIDLSEVKQGLVNKDLPEDYVDQVITGEEQKVSEKLRLPTKGDLTDWLELQIIDEVFYSEYMAKLGYQSEDIQLYLTEFSMKQDTSKRKFLTIKTYQRWLKNGIMEESTFRTTGGLMSISADDIDTLILEVAESNV